MKANRDSSKACGGGGGGGGGCYFHPKEVVVGVCPLCLHDKLLKILAASSNQTQHSPPSISTNNNTRRRKRRIVVGTQQQHNKSTSTINFHNIFAFGSLLNPLHLLHKSNNKSHLDPNDHGDDDDDDLDTSTSQEDSFISIKFEDNGGGSWEKNSNNNINVSNKEKEEEENNNKSGTLVGHAKNKVSLRWRKRIGQLFQLIKWKKRSNKANVCHVGTKVEGVKVMRKHKQGWLTTLTKRKTN